MVTLLPDFRSNRCRITAEEGSSLLWWIDGDVLCVGDDKQLSYEEAPFEVRETMKVLRRDRETYFLLEDDLEEERITVEQHNQYVTEAEQNSLRAVKKLARMKLFKRFVGS